jgi:hypothetical protein
MGETTKCSLCNAVMPVAGNVLGKALGTAIFGGLGIKKSETAVGQFAMLLLGFGLGHVADMLVHELSRPICGACGTLPDRPRSSMRGYRRA